MNSFAGRVLVVDDDPTVRHMLSRVLRTAGYESREASDGQQALQVVQQAWPEVVLLDLTMPGEDGMELLRQAKAIDRNLSVVIITGDGRARNAVAAMQAGAHDYLVKPFEQADVLRAVLSAVTSRGLRQTIQELSGRTREAASLRDQMGTSEPIATLSAEVAEGRRGCSEDLWTP
jgi:DNA-binding NtrC family response regulator